MVLFLGVILCSRPVVSIIVLSSFQYRANGVSRASRGESRCVGYDSLNKFRKNEMTLFKKTAVLAFATFASAAAVAADPITHTIQLVATVPTSDFYVEPVDPTWVGKEQVLAWN